jgi:hypothetical protein
MALVIKANYINMDDDLLSVQAAALSKIPTNIGTTESNSPTEIPIIVKESQTSASGKFNIRNEINEFLKEPKPKVTPFLARLNTVTYDATKVKILLD